jgi:hypothetical protein
MKYVTVIGSDGKVVAVGKLQKYYGKWLMVQRNDNEVVAVNTDFVRAIHFMELPTQGMIASMSKSIPTAEEGYVDDGPRIAVKQTSGKMERSVEEVVQSLVEAGPPGRQPETGAGIFALPSKAPLPDGVNLDDEILDPPPEARKRKKRK